VLQPVCAVTDGIYSEIAVALKGGVLRQTSMGMLAVALGRKPSARMEIDDESDAPEEPLKQLGMSPSEMASGTSASATSSFAAQTTDAASDSLHFASTSTAQACAHSIMAASDNEDVAQQPSAPELGLATPSRGEVELFDVAPLEVIKHEIDHSRRRSSGWL
jgi:hypothetical protein